MQGYQPHKPACAVQQKNTHLAFAFNLLAAQPEPAHPEYHKVTLYYSRTVRRNWL